MKVRIKFSKLGYLKYIGHLDVMRAFQKVMRRAEIDICYSEGFSPHQKMSFASPLGLGLTSEGEYVDIEVNSTESSERMLERLNEVMVEGMEALSYVQLPENAKTAMAVVAACDYMVNFDEEISEDFKIRFDKFLEEPSIIVSRQTKKQVLETDIKPLIYKKDWRRNDLFLQVSSGSVANLKPEQVLEAFFSHTGMDPESCPFHVHRLEMYADLSKNPNKRKLVPLEGMGEVIA